MRNDLKNDDRPCVKCGSRRTRIIGQSVSPPVYYVTCSACGHTSVVASSPTPTPASASGNVDTQRVERIVRTLVTEFDLPADLVSVTESAQGWLVVLRTKLNRIVRVHVLSAEPEPIHAAITRALTNA